MDEFMSRNGVNEDNTDQADAESSAPAGAEELEAVLSENMTEVEETAESVEDAPEPAAETAGQAYDNPYSSGHSFVRQPYNPNGRYDDRPVFAAYEAGENGSQASSAYGSQSGQAYNQNTYGGSFRSGDGQNRAGARTQNSYGGTDRMEADQAGGSAYTQNSYGGTARMEADQAGGGAYTQNSYGRNAQTGEGQSYGTAYTRSSYGGNGGAAQSYTSGSTQGGSSNNQSAYGGQERDSGHGQGIYGGRSSGQRSGTSGTGDDSQRGIYGGMPRGASGGSSGDTDNRARYDSYRFNDPDGLNNLDGTPGSRPKKRNKAWRIAALVAIIALIIGCFVAIGYTGFRIFSQKNAGSAEKSEAGQEALPTPEVHLGNQEGETDSDEASRKEETAEDEASKDEADTSRAAESAGKASYSGEELTVVEVVQLCMPSMVAITNTSVTEYQNMFGETHSYEDVSAGSGIIVGETETELLIATNNHVITGAKDITVTFVDDEAVSGSIKGTDVENDLAIVAVETKAMSEETLKAIRIINIGNSDECVVGESVVAIGNALGYGQTVTSGIISALNREVTVDGAKHILLQTDASINPGNSGGALINMRGELIGINEVKYADTDVEGFGYAIPMATAEPILTELGSKVPRDKVVGENASYIGITCKTVPSYYTRMGYPAGVYVSTVDEKGPAEKAGIVAGDIITSIDGVAVTTTEELIEQLTYYAAGETIKFRIRRMNEEQTAFDTEDIMVTLGKRTDTDLFENTEPT